MYPFHTTKQNVPIGKFLTKDEMMNHLNLSNTINIGHKGSSHTSNLGNRLCFNKSGTDQPSDK